MPRAKKMSPILLGWMAGVIEMRGKIRRVDNPMRKTAQLILQVRSRHLAQIGRLCDMTGTAYAQSGARTLEFTDRKGCAEHCPEPHVHITSELPAMAAWAVTGAGAAIVLHNLLPYLCESEGMSQWVDEIVEMLPASGRGYHAVKTSCTRLAALGWAIPEGLLTAEKPAERAAAA